MRALRRRAPALAAGLLLTLAAVVAIAANVALLDRGTSPGEPVGRLGRDLGRTRPAATQPDARPAQARPRPRPPTSVPSRPRTNDTGSATGEEIEEPEGWDDDD